MKRDSEAVWRLNKVLIIVLADIAALLSTVCVSVGLGGIFYQIQPLWGIMAGAWGLMCGYAARAWLNARLIEWLIIPDVIADMKKEEEKK